ncbi:GNAT family N-acetyltransferase [Taibaiella soli]|uniref:GNAT family N-acetyltransferase n=1 Tax=Taibaiella soli TaxID=1649169 RepID=A0A2W2B639_9BACT|nr:GNAT family N-acetyltransferase [Taibaiella soli]PZF71447.1 GNAT family N-acetyltransferase [Taibaiella soli]
MIRTATLQDHSAISELLTQLGYPGTEAFLPEKLERMLQDPDELMFVYETEEKVAGFMSVHFIPQIARRGDYATISFFAVDNTMRSKGIGKAMEDYATAKAIERGCEGIFLHCNTHRADAHRFYFRQGYTESPKYLLKKL